MNNSRHWSLAASAAENQKMPSSICWQHTIQLYRTRIGEPYNRAARKPYMPTLRREAIASSVLAGRVSIDGLYCVAIPSVYLPAWTNLSLTTSGVMLFSVFHSEENSLENERSNSINCSAVLCGSSTYVSGTSSSTPEHMSKNMTFLSLSSQTPFNHRQNPQTI